QGGGGGTAQSPCGSQGLTLEDFLVGSGLWLLEMKFFRGGSRNGGCGAMYEVHIESEEFREKRPVQQHQMVNQALSEEIKSMHGLRIFTSTPKP
uniref:BolA family member 3 n=1 Tax=Anser cygnoides TaxID=8845 RepID=A0A8B9DW17_ANSCY